MYEHKQDPRCRLQPPPSAHGAHPSQGCGLELCSWKAGMPAQAANIGMKRKGRDDPRTAKRSKFDYDDKPKAGKQEYESTCFFWYHGFKCAKSSEAAFSYMCGWKHAMTDPPSIVPVPPGDVHATRPCELEWCASHQLRPAANSGSSITQSATDQQAGDHKSKKDNRKASAGDLLLLVPRQLRHITGPKEQSRLQLPPRTDRTAINGSTTTRLQAPLALLQTVVSRRCTRDPHLERHSPKERSPAFARRRKQIRQRRFRRLVPHRL